MKLTQTTVIQTLKDMRSYSLYSVSGCKLVRVTLCTNLVTVPSMKVEVLPKAWEERLELAEVE